MWNFSSTLGRPNSEEKERKRRIREAQLQQIQRELTLDRKLISGSADSNRGGHFRSRGGGGGDIYAGIQRSKTFKHHHPQPEEFTNLVKLRPKKELNNNNSNHSHHKSSRNSKYNDDFVSRLRFFDSASPELGGGHMSYRHSSAFLTPGEDELDLDNHDLLTGMKRRYTMASTASPPTAGGDSEDSGISAHATSPRNVTFFGGPLHGGAGGQREQKLRFSDQPEESTIGTRSSRISYPTSDDGFGDYRSAQLFCFCPETSHKKILCNTRG